MRADNCSSQPSKSPGELPERALRGTRRHGKAVRPRGQPGLFGATAVAISAVDLTSKAVAQSLLHETLVHTNPALSLGHAPFAPEVQLPAAGIGLAVYSILALWCIATQRLPPWPLATLLGGALGNFMDRLEGDGIIDFIRIGDLIFNLADVAVLVGVGGAGALGVARLFRAGISPR